MGNIGHMYPAIFSDIWNTLDADHSLSCASGESGAGRSGVARVVLLLVLVLVPSESLRLPRMEVALLALLVLLLCVALLLLGLWTCLPALWALIRPDSVDLANKFGSWAVVTGSTDGIGKAYALELARRGLNIVLISRTQKKLDEVAAEISALHGVKTKTIAADFSKGKEVFDYIEKELSDIPVGILVNNVGRQYTYPMYLAEVPEQELWDIVNINIGATTMMTRMLLPQMCERLRGAIINVSSGSELQPLPLMTVYAASKVFVKSFSDALRHEYGQYGITIQHLSPLFVNTKMNAFSHRLQSSNIFVPDATTYARNAVSTLGRVNNTTGYWAHSIQYFLTIIPPVWVRTYIGGLMNQTFRKDYFKEHQMKPVPITGHLNY